MKRFSYIKIVKGNFLPYKYSDFIIYKYSLFHKELIAANPYPPEAQTNSKS